MHAGTKPGLKKTRKKRIPIRCKVCNQKIGFIPSLNAYGCTRWDEHGFYPAEAYTK